MNDSYYPWLYVNRSNSKTAEFRARERNAVVKYMDGRQMHDYDSLIAGIKTSVGLPEYVGHNWNALLDCLRDLYWLPESPAYYLVWDDANNLLIKSSTDFFEFVDVCRSAAEFWHNHAKVFALVIRDDVVHSIASLFQEAVVPE